MSSPQAWGEIFIPPSLGVWVYKVGGLLFATVGARGIEGRSPLTSQEASFSAIRVTLAHRLGMSCVDEAMMSSNQPAYVSISQISLTAHYINVK